MSSNVNDSGARGGGGKSGAVLSFLGMANIAVRLVTKQYPGAQLLEGDGVSPSGPTTDVNNVNSWRFVFRTQDGGTAFIQSSVWGEFNPITYVPHPWLEDVVIPWPISMDITKAAALLTQAGYSQPYGYVTLRWPLYPGIEEPYYIFSMPGVGYVFVGVYDGAVTTHPGNQGSKGSGKGSGKGSKKSGGKGSKKGGK